MPDTGAPWNIPYVEPSDLVRDWPALSEDVADAVAAGLTAAGVIKQVVSVTKTDTFSTSSTSYVDVTGLSVAITPTSATNKVLVFATVSLGRSGDFFTHGRLMRDSTALAIGDAASTRSRDTISEYPGSSGSGFQIATSPVVFLDSPGDIVSTTYKMQVRADGSSVFVNRTGTDTDATTNPRTVSSITVVEVAA
jgi:hypothetical protein